MTKDELIAALKELVEQSPSEESHMDADAWLLQYIDDPDITDAFNAIDKWYA